MHRGVIYVAFGHNAKMAKQKSYNTLRKVNPDLPVFTIDETTFTGNPGFGARWAKLNVDKIAPLEWEQILYLDADTLVHQSLEKGFEILEDGWDMALTASINQGGDCFRHIGVEERIFTQDFIGDAFPLQLQLGLFYFNRDTCGEFFEAWRKEWERFKEQDQGAFMRAYYKLSPPVKIWLLGRPYNDTKKDSIVQHLFGKAV